MSPIIQEYIKYSLWEGRATLAVAVGVIIEFLPEVPEIYHHPCSGKSILKIIGVALVCFGICLEFICGAHLQEITKVSFTDLISKNDRQGYDIYEMEESHTFHDVPQDQLENLANGLKAYSGKKYEIYTCCTDPNCTNLLSRLTKTFDKAGWKNVTLVSAPPPLVFHGVRAFISPHANKEIIAATGNFYPLAHAGFIGMPLPSADVKFDDRIVIQIGLRP